jgi:hypothetical protein
MLYGCCLKIFIKAVIKNVSNILWPYVIYRSSRPHVVCDPM